MRWWTRDELAAADPGRFDPHLFRFLAALDRGDLDAIAGTMLDWHNGHSAETLAARHTYLAVTDPGAAIEALWHIITEHGEADTAPLARAAGANPVLRRAWPWISHGTLHLYDRRDRPGLVNHGRAFHPAVGGFRVRPYGGETHAPEPTQAAVGRAAEIVASWQD